MKFGRIDLEDALAAILAHTVVVDGVPLKKGTVLNAAHIQLLRAADYSSILAAKLDDLDIGEDDAARRIGECLRLENIKTGIATTGRVNFYAESAGVFNVDARLVDAINGVDSSITLATLSKHARVEPNTLVATVKIIPFSVTLDHLQMVQKLAFQKTAFSIKRFQPLKIGLIQSVLPNIKDSVLDKTLAITRNRLAKNQGELVVEMRAPHEIEAIGSAIQRVMREVDMVVLFGASAVCDPRDILPEAIRYAGGEVKRIGMPVDPGNLLILAELHGKPVLGAPGCARSPKDNGFDWVLNRLMAGMKVSELEIAKMGVGGLLNEIATRPSPRDVMAMIPNGEVAIAVLAAGRSSRMGTRNKLLSLFDGVHLVRRSVETAIAAGGRPVIVVLGHMANEIDRALNHLNIKTIVNPHFSEGLSSSIKAALDHVPPQAKGLMIHLADMPAINASHLRRLISAFEKTGHKAIVRAVNGDIPGNPVILPRALLAELADISGDRGARSLIENSGLQIIDIDIGDAALVDVDTAEALIDAGGGWE